MFSCTAEYALRAIVFLAMNQERSWPAADIAESTKIPAGYVSKVLQDLARAELLKARRGPNGGFALARNPSQISVLEAVNAVDRIERIHTCPLGIASHGRNLCRLHTHLDRAIAAAEQTLADVTVADMMTTEISGSRCQFPGKCSKFSVPTISAARPRKG